MDVTDEMDRSDRSGHFVIIILILNIHVISHTCMTPPPLLPSLKYKKSVGSPIALPIIQKDDALLIPKSIVRSIVLI